MLALPRWVVKGLTRLHLREEAQAAAEELLVEIRDILNAQTAPPRRRINQVFRPQSRPSA